jgi:hypothetical protein
MNIEKFCHIPIETFCVQIELFLSHCIKCSLESIKSKDANLMCIKDDGFLGIRLNKFLRVLILNLCKDNF